MSHLTDLVWPDVRGLAPDSLPRRAVVLGSPDIPWDAATELVPGARVARNSAVLMLFIKPVEPGQPARLLFMRRSTTVRSHKGQIGLAGGRAEPGDRSPADTALREMQEELGIEPGRVKVVGLLPPGPALDTHRVWPVLGAAAIDLQDLKLEPSEVASVFAEPWPLFGAGKAQDFRFNIFGKWRTSQLYMVPGGAVWGLTARLLDGARLA